MDATMERIILGEIQENRKELKEFRAEVAKWREEDKERIVTLEVKSADISGNGQPGRMKNAEDAIHVLQRDKYWVMGWAAGIAGLATTLFEVIHTYLVKH